MRATFNRVDVIYERVHVFIVGAVVGESYFYGNALFFSHKMDDIVDERFFVGVDIAYEFFKSGVAMEHFIFEISVLIHLAAIGQSQCYAGVKEREVAQTIGKSIVVIYRHGEYRVVGLESDHSPSFVAFAYYGKLACGLSAGIFLHICFSVAVHFCAKIS